jgi:hypothetical protein
MTDRSYAMVSTKLLECLTETEAEKCTPAAKTMCPLSSKYMLLFGYAEFLQGF